MPPKINSNNKYDLDDILLLTLKNEKSKSVKELANSIEKTYRIPKKHIMERILILQKQGKMLLKDTPTVRGSLKNYIFSISGLWYPVILSLSLVAISLILIDLSRIPFIGTVLVYARYFFGSLFILFFPGYVLIKALFPFGEIDNVERLALSIGVSLVIVAINAFSLNFTSWGISTTPIALSLFGLNIGIGTIALMREYQLQSPQ